MQNFEYKEDESEQTNSDEDSENESYEDDY